MLLIALLEGASPRLQEAAMAIAEEDSDDDMEDAWGPQQSRSEGQSEAAVEYTSHATPSGKRKHRPRRMSQIVRLHLERARETND